MKWSGPSLNAGQSQVAVEEIEIAHEGLVLYSPSSGVAALTGGFSFCAYGPEHPPHLVHRPSGETARAAEASGMSETELDRLAAVLLERQQRLLPRTLRAASRPTTRPATSGAGPDGEVRVHFL